MLTRILNKIQFNFKLGPQTMLCACLDWDGDILYLKGRPYFVYRCVVHDVLITDWIWMLIHHFRR